MIILHHGKEFHKWLKTNNLSVAEIRKKLNKKYNSEIYAMFKVASFRTDTIKILQEKLGYMVSTYYNEEKESASVNEKNDKDSYISDEFKSEASVLDFTKFRLIPVVSRFAYASYAERWDDPEYINHLETIPVDLPKDGKYLCFEVKGDSMSYDKPNSIEDGDKVIGRELKREYWGDKLRISDYSEWVIVHKQRGILVKSIISQDIEKGDIVCHSYNPIEKDLTINLDDVNSLFYVVEHHKRKGRKRNYF